MLRVAPKARTFLADKVYDADWFRAASAERKIDACPSPSNWGSAGPARSCSLQETPQNKEPVRQAKELEAHPQTLWPLRAHLFLKHLHHRHFYLPALIL
ncbi:hypothetical protein RMR10_016245 [Agrobacterium rosae]|uniref:hypothetical protein n=1 Tax=Agrobacterium rosae TaxID=1972867 RepID=UPI002A1032BA|nr:hypothetical protein [Agrobacterium rosae]MDX8315857.1 hypothetical protein [Agrobacterium rosae]